MKIVIASDHHGVVNKSHLVQRLAAAGYTLEDLGPVGHESVDYPDFASLVAHRVSNGEADRGILICGTGIGMAIAANKIHGIRAAVCDDESTARISRQHNDVNVLCLSGDSLDPPTSEAIAKVWLETEFEGGRHGRRTAKIRELESC